MTKRELYNAVIENKITEEVIDGFRELVDGLDHTNELRKVATAKKAAEKSAEKEPVRQALLAVITAEPKTATMLIAEAGLEIKPQAIPSLLKGYVEDGRIAKVDVKVKGKGTQKGYQLAE